MKKTPLVRKTPMKRAASKPSKISMHRSALKQGTKKLRTRERAVSAEDKRLWDRMAQEVGCIACLLDGHPNTYVSIHHIDGRTKLDCHKEVLPLCAPHHQQDDSDMMCRIAVHPNKARFEARYGSQYELLDQVKEKLGIQL